MNEKKILETFTGQDSFQRNGYTKEKSSVLSFSFFNEFFYWCLPGFYSLTSESANDTFFHFLRLSEKGKEEYSTFPCIVLLHTFDERYFFIGYFK